MENININENSDTKNCCSTDPTPLDTASKTIKDFYDSVASGSGPYTSKTDKFSPSEPTEQIVRYIHDSGKSRILDIGCGMGTTLLRLLKEYTKGDQFIGVDFSDKMIDRAREESSLLSPEHRKKVGFFPADAQNLPYMDEQFDLIYSECVFNLMSNREKAISEVSRLLSPEGIFIYTDFVSFADVPDDIQKNLNLVSGCRAGSITLSQNIQFLENNGFTKIECVDFTESKNRRYAELMTSSEEIQNDFQEFQQQYPNSADFLDKKVGYYLLIGTKSF